MAKYTINYACGHGSFVEQLFGKEKERERRIKWLGETRVCPECYKAEHKTDAPIVYMSTSMYFGGPGALKICFTGNTYPIKDILKSNGYRFSDQIAKHTDFLGVSMPVKGWYKVLSTAEELRAGKCDEQAIVDAVNFAHDTFDVDVAMPGDIELFVGANIK